MKRTQDHANARQGRRVALVIAGTMLAWIGIQTLGLDFRTALLFDFLALAAMVWCFVNIIQMWRRRGD